MKLWIFDSSALKKATGLVPDKRNETDKHTKYDTRFLGSNVNRVTNIKYSKNIAKMLSKFVYRFWF
jgi:hypothetical protein